MDKPMIIVFDSANNTGKSHISKLICNRLRKLDYTVAKLFQPFYPENRKVLLSRELNYKQEYDLFLKDRTKLHNEYVKNTDSDIVLMDRSFVSSLVYQAIKFNDQDMLNYIIRTTSNLYSELNYKIFLGVLLETDVDIISKRNRLSSKSDYRDTDDIQKIKDELAQYTRAWSIAYNTGIFKSYITCQNNNKLDADSITNNIIDIVTDNI
jgi:thymidylate kinase